MDAQTAVLLQHFAFIEQGFRFRRFDLDGVLVFRDLQDLALHQTGDLAFIDHSHTGNADDVNLVTLDFVFDDVGDDVARVAPLGEDGHLLFPVGQIVGQVDAAIAVPHQGVNRFRRRCEAGLIHHGHASFAEADNHVHGALFEQSTGNVLDLLSVSYHVMLPWPYL